MFKTLKRRIYTYTMGYKDYQEEIQENSVVLQIKYSKYLFWFFFSVYSIDSDYGCLFLESLLS